MKYYTLGLLAVITILFSCRKETSTSITDFLARQILIGQAVLQDGGTLDVYSPDSLSTGYNPVYIRIRKGDAVVSSEVVTLSTLMDMGEMKHSSPSVPPVFDAGDQCYKGAVVFTMPSDTKQWSVTVGSGDEKQVFAVNVKQAATKVVASYTGTDGNDYVLSLLPNKNFRVGLNDFSLFISKKESSMSFVPATGLAVEFSPEMVSMGHGSLNNVNPVDTGAGFYNGKANFTMSGDWRLHFKISSGSSVLPDDAFLDILF